jgi:hypothetical protein
MSPAWSLRGSTRLTTPVISCSYEPCSGTPGRAGSRSPSPAVVTARAATPTGPAAWCSTCGPSTASVRSTRSPPGSRSRAALLGMRCSAPSRPGDSRLRSCSHLTSSPWAAPSAPTRTAATWM